VTGKATTLERMAAGEEGGLAEAVDEALLPPDPAPLARQTLAYGLTGLIAPLAGLITLPIFARVLTRAEYGIIELGYATLTVALALTDAGMSSAALRSFYDYGSNEEEERRTVVTTAFATTTVLAVAVAAVIVLLRDELSRWIFGVPLEGTLLVVIACLLLTLNTWRFASEVMRVRLMAFSYLATALVAATLTTVISVTGVLALDWRVKGIFLAGVIGNSVAAAFALTSIRHSFGRRLSRIELRRMLAYGLPLVPAAVSAWALALIDRIILSHIGSLQQVGQYAIANRLASLLTLGMTAFLFALTPFLLSTYSDDPEKEKAARARTLTYLTFVLSLGGLVLTLFAKEIIDVVAPRFGEAYKAVGPLTLGLLGYGVTSLLAIGLMLARTTGRGAILTLLAAGVNIGLNFALIPSFGIVGAAVATTVGYALLAITYYVASQRIYHTPYELRRVFTILGLACAFGVLGVVPLGPAAVAIPVKLGALAAYCACLWLTRAVTSAELSELRKFVLGMIPLQLVRARA
jgi:O-antigen/teichoic acid export membrane protein